MLKQEENIMVKQDLLFMIADTEESGIKKPENFCKFLREKGYRAFLLVCRNYPYYDLYEVSDGIRITEREWDENEYQLVESLKKEYMDGI